MEGGDKLMIQTNIIRGNENGIVLLHSDGVVEHNRIIENDSCGICCVSETVSKIESNQIEN